jgi:hypothetical protein
MTTQKLMWGIALIMAMMLSATASAQIRVASSVVASGGGPASSGGIILSGTIGQAVIGPTVTTTMKAGQGFWYTLDVELPPVSVPVTPGGGRLAEGAFMQSWPNPFSREAELEVRIPSSGPVSLKLFDAFGREVSTLIDGDHQEAGVLSVRIDGTTLESGSYTAQLMTGGARHAIKLVVVK